jgi:hypothetical protein
MSYVVDGLSHCLYAILRYLYKKISTGNTDDNVLDRGMPDMRGLASIIILMCYTIST